MTINELVLDSYKNAKEKGFYERPENQNVGCLLMQIVSELSEAMEAHRQGKITTMPHCFVELETYNIKDNFEVEIADAFIRLASLCGYLNIDIEEFIKVKMQINKLREPLHGKKY
ncbi:hypothetical protein [Treponema pedis]|uniref:hypothetical protein n=1 Tax=Treponema pedis TaxID=409322 RepID=UPI0003FF8DD5|nr:hypothetical protein [Treponema pedis]